jgi:DNA polymerase III subunit epsilon
MSFWSSWRPAKPSLSASQQAAVAAYQALPKTDLNAKLDQQRFVVVDVESTGLDVHSDCLIAIGAISVAQGTIWLDRGFEVVLQQDAPSSIDNILIHGIDGTTQTQGRDPTTALLDFLGYLGNAPLVAYHAPFDQTMIDKATVKFLGIKVSNPWIDLAYVAPALYPELAKGMQSLDHWTPRFNIVNASRHNAVADALATAQLLSVLLARAQQREGDRLRDLLALEKAQRWLTR